MVEKVEVMLSRAVDELPGSPGWAYEPKLDGFRCVLATSEFGDVRLTSRRGKSLGRYFPEVVAAGRRLSTQLVLDGELVVPTGGGVDFAALQRRLHPSVARAAQLARESPAALAAFDVLAEQGRDLRGRSYDERRAILEALLATPTSSVGLMPMTVDPEAARAWFGEQPPGVEGVVAKKRTQRYRPGVRGWQKLRIRRTAEAVIGGVLGSLERPEALVLGRYQAGRLRVAGHTGPLPAADRAALAARLRPPQAPHPWPERLPSSRFGQLPGDDIDYTQVAPEVVVEIETYTALEHGRWRHTTRYLRARTDLTASELAADSA